MKQITIGIIFFNWDISTMSSTMHLFCPLKYSMIVKSRPAAVAIRASSSWLACEQQTYFVFPVVEKRRPKIRLLFAGYSWHVLAQKSSQQAPKAFWWRGLITQFLRNLNSSKNFTCPSGKLLRTGFTSPMAKSTSPGLSDTTFFARCVTYLI